MNMRADMRKGEVRMPKFTTAQQTVIDLRDKNILVSAAAGSGKTAVLVERIIQMVTDKDNPIDIDKLLVVTFTNAAASQMRERILNAIEEKAIADPDNEHLQKQLTYIHNANICTIDSFCLNVVKDNFTYLDIDPAFAVGDEGDLKLMRADAIKETLEAAYTEKSEDFIDFVEQYSNSRSDKDIEDIILKLYNFSMSYVEPHKWLESCVNYYDLTYVEDMKSTPWMKLIMDDISTKLTSYKSEIDDCLRLALDEGGPDMYEEAINYDKSFVEKLLCLDDYDKMAQMLGKYEPLRLSTKKGEGVNPDIREEVKNRRNAVKDGLRTLKKDYFFTDLDSQIDCIKQCKKTIDVIIRLVLDFEGRYQEKKREKNLVDFSDVEHLALEILTEKKDGVIVPSKVADEMAFDYYEIMIDEYQDSNYVQETLMKSISSERFGRPNMFMVGDVKQSIYKFRLARPEIFIDKYNEFTPVKNVEESEKKDGNSRRITLDKNFRSRREVLDATNYIFNQIMGRNLGGIEYDEDNRLNQGADYKEVCATQNEKAEIILVNTKAGDEMDEIFLDKSSKEMEAYVVATRIKELVADKFMVTDKDTNEYRPVRYSDIVILLRSVSGTAEVYQKVLENEGISAYCESQSGYFNATEIVDVLNIIRVIDNPIQDIPLVAALTSKMFDFTDTDIAYIKTISKLDNKTSHYYDYLLAAREKREVVEEVVYRKIERFFHFLDKYRAKVAYSSMYSIITQILDETDYMHYVTALPGGKRRSANLSMLIKKAIDFDAGTYKGVFNFIRYIERIEKYDIDCGEASVISENDNSVRIMTIHKSKGLEFPVVFVSGLGKKHNKLDTRGKLCIHPDIGIGIDLILADEKLRINTLIKKAVAKAIDQDNIAEELRVLYVALTRAKEKLIMTGAVKNLDTTLKKWEGAKYEEDDKLSKDILMKSSGILDLIGYTIDRKIGMPFGVVVKEVSDIVDDKMTDTVCKSEKKTFLSDFDYEYGDSKVNPLKKYIEYEYPYKTKKLTTSKMSVSDIKKMNADFVVEDKAEDKYIPVFAREREEVTGAYRGTVYHKILELFNYSMVPFFENYDKMLNDMISKGCFTKSDTALVNIEDLISFAHSGIGKRMKQAFDNGNLKREQKFVVGVKASEIDSEYSENETIVVQGIIDALFEEDGELIIVDYKTDYVSDFDELKSRYSEQLKYYAKAVEKITGKKVKEKIIYSIHLTKEESI